MAQFMQALHLNGYICAMNLRMGGYGGDNNEGHLNDIAQILKLILERDIF